MLAFDIETLGLLHQKPLPAITCACLYDGATETRLLFYGVSEEEHAANTQILFKLLDEADVLGGFNAVSFDLEYIRRALHATDAQMQAWVVKCVDPFMCLKHILRRTCKLNVLLELNGLQCKTGSGLEAIALAHAGEFEKLMDYCVMDAILTYQVCTLPEIRFTDVVYGSISPAGVWHIVSRAPPAPPPVPPPTLREVLFAAPPHSTSAVEMRIKRLYFYAFCSMDKAEELRARLTALVVRTYAPILVVSEKHSVFEVIILSKRMKRTEEAWQTYLEENVAGLRIQTLVQLHTGSTEALTCVDSRFGAAHQQTDAFWDTFRHLSGGRMHAHDTRAWLMSIKAIGEMHNDTIDLLLAMHQKQRAYFALVRSLVTSSASQDMVMQERLQEECMAAEAEILGMFRQASQAESVLQKQAGLHKTCTAETHTMREFFARLEAARGECFGIHVHPVHHNHTAEMLNMILFEMLVD